MKNQISQSILTIESNFLCGYNTNHPLQKIDSLGKITVGKLMPSYVGSSSSARAMDRISSSVKI